MWRVLRLGQLWLPPVILAALGIIVTQQIDDAVLRAHTSFRFYQIVSTINDIALVSIPIVLYLVWRLAAQRERTVNDQLKASEQMREDLTNMLVHDLRTPLTSLLSGLQTLQALGELDATQAELVDIAYGGGGRLLGMVNDLLDVAKLEDGSLRLACDDLDASVLVAEALGQVAPLAAEKSLTLDSHLAAGLPHLQADGVKLSRALVNLLGNAIKFTPDHGQVTVSANLPDEPGYMRFTVADTGEGIPAEALDRVFDKFAQVETRRAGRGASTGLGLTFCKMVVEAHGGRIWVESAVGEGSAFHFQVPLLSGANCLLPTRTTEHK